jgi:hypothetical protein
MDDASWCVPKVRLMKCVNDFVWINIKLYDNQFLCCESRKSKIF